MLHLGVRARVVLDESQVGRVVARRPEPGVPSEPTTSVLDEPRLNLQTEATDSVDGVWRPASRDLAAELPPVLAELSERIGPVERVAYNLDAWDAVPRKIVIDGATVRMAGFHSLAADTVHMIGARRRLVLTVVPADAGDHAASTADSLPTSNGTPS
jgi:Family of unknown function (DUF5994)